MKAAVLTGYGPVENFQLREVEKPVPKKGEILLKVHAASINSWDWEILKGTPFANRIMFGLTRPRPGLIVGCDVAGVVESLGPGVDMFQPGAEVYGDISHCNWGGFAEYVCASQTAFVKKPAGMSFEQAAAIPQAGLLALQGLRYNGGLQPGQKALFIGAGGGSGMFAVQKAKRLGVEFTGVDRGEKLDKLKELGADHVVDFQLEDVAESGLRYDMILDVAVCHPVSYYERMLNPGGAFVVIGGSMGRIIQTALFGPVLSRIKGKKLGLLIHKPDREDLAHMNGLFEAGKMTPVIDSVFPLERIVDAFRHYEEKRFVGKIVISIDAG
ncbi:MAG: NAD(P)-dependent alcohol dehydrogenase [Nitrospinota bacterium]|nr:NAD(P)-dependent alcohol dehydrogenase [Nitrospinota bacterium]